MDANIVTVQAPNGTLIFQTEYNRSTIHPEYLPFSAYAPAGIVQTVSDISLPLSTLICVCTRSK